MSAEKRDEKDERIQDLEVDAESAADVAGGDGTQPSNTLTNVQKSKHDAAMAAIQNTR
jgi:hypothetical protein